MMRSLFSGVSGLRNHQTRMDVIGNNIANVNTVGFKAGRVNFQDVLSQTLQGASSGGNNRGGTNPLQVGLGMGLASIDTIFTDGSFQPTGKQTDLSIQGQGFFILSNGQNQLYTRAGSFDFDNQGNFLVPGTGYKVMGWQTTDTTGETIITTGPVQPINIPVGKPIPAAATKSVTYANNLSADATDGTAVETSISIYDSLGNEHKLTATYTKLTANTWEVTYSVDGGSITAASPTATLTFLENGALSTVNGSTTDFTHTLSFDFSGNGADAAQSIKLDFSQLKQYGGGSTVQAVNQDGYAAGTLESTSIDPTGVIVGRFSNGQSRSLAQIALATFNNPAGLNKIGESLFAKSTNSGEAQIGPSGSGGRGKFNPGTLEMSNVDLAQEFSNMIITQRGFQANSKIISVTDEMLQELANLKR